MSELSLIEINKSFGGSPVVRDFSLQIGSGELLVLLGPSGSGKTTLLRMIAGLESWDSGDIAIEGKSLAQTPAQQRDTAMVFQDYALYPHMTVLGNLSFPLKAKGLKKADITVRVRDVAEQVGLAELLERTPDQLSGGQQQRLALGRALIRDAKILLMDEPLSNIDSRLRDEMRTLLRNIHQQLQQTILYVTHDQSEAMAIADRIAIVNEGSIQQVDSPEQVYWRPKNRMVARFLGAPPLNIIRLRRGEGSLASNDFITRAISEREVDLAIRPEHLMLASPSEDSICFECAISEVCFAGSHRVAQLTYDSNHLSMIAPADCVLCPGENVTVFVPLSKLLFFELDGSRIQTAL